MTFTNNLKIHHNDKHLIVQIPSSTQTLTLLQIKCMLQSYRMHQSIAAAQRNEPSQKPNFSLESVTYKENEAIKITGNLRDAVNALEFHKSQGLINYDLPDSLSPSISNNSNIYFAKNVKENGTTPKSTTEEKITQSDILSGFVKTEF